MKIKIGEQDGDYYFICPGCKSSHYITTKRKNSNSAQWSFNGNVNNPTFSPSINSFIDFRKLEDEDKENRIERCHFFIREGRIEFVSDCTHELTGQTVSLPDMNP